MKFKKSKESFYAPYGAYELKANYQRNMLLANGIVVGLFVLIIAGFALFANDVVADIPPDDGVNDGVIFTIKDMPLPPMIIRDIPDFPASKPDNDIILGIPEPVPDDEIFDEEITLATKDELAPRIEQIDFGGAGDVLLVDDSEVIKYPGIEDFVKVEIMAEMIYQHPVDYPRLAKQAGIEGSVWIKSLVDIDGSVKEAVIYKTSKNASLDQAALDASKKYKYKPAIQNKRPVAVWVAYKVVFKLETYSE